MPPSSDGSARAGVSSEAPALRRCITGNAEDFGRKYWSREPMLSRAADLPGDFLDLLSPDDIDDLVAERGLRMPFFRMVRDGSVQSGPTRYATAGSRRIGDLIDADRARERYADGATLVLQSLHRIHPPVVRFCRRLAADLGHATQANAYITPPGNRGFDPHHDTHDVFVLQIDGSKLWHIYEPALVLPLSTQSSSDLAKKQPLVPDGAEPVLSVVLEPGDALYLPRGYVHSAETNDDRSIHLTVGVLATTHYDVLRDVLTLAGESEQFRDALPLGAASDPGRLATEVLPDLLRRAADWFATVEPGLALGAIEGRLENAVPAEPRRFLASTDGLASLDKSTAVRPRLGAHFVLSRADGSDRAEAPENPADTVTLTSRTRSLRLPGYVERAVRAATAGPTLTVSDVAEASDGALSVDDALVLVRRLLREGVLVTA
ncbi:MAG TPA: cupin domain-containing protein [Frankiaceae bacterium]|nr:cupin domain-containing protein [Frankiaceae bacterium]